ncbi:CHAT domain-containing protein [Amycolatopsis australiensis]|uniref:CHAT domain-containing protein n=1 Tax=Amycolatopsis australiensis TaxID=546364 RepID=A0A1K1R9X6_9PSEU|nr:CHAT domain-containing protein [Amycolatopsis australiensis]SFW68943.1 CHAT domain-containing protein [Amycolatopsis australiensis]
MTNPDPSELIARVRDLQRAATDASCVARFHEGVRLLRRGMALLDSIHPVEAAYRTQWLVARIRLASTLAAMSSEISGDVAAGLAGLDDVRLLINAIEDPVLQAELNGALNHNYGLRLMTVGRNDDSIAHFTQSLADKDFRLTHGPDPEAWMGAYVQTLSTRGWAHTRLGNVTEAWQDLTRSIEIAEKYELHAEAADVRRILGTLALRTGDVPEALRLYDEGERTYRGLDMDVPPPLRLERAQALMAAGLADEASDHLEEAMAAMVADNSVGRELAQAELHRASAALMNDELDMARQMAAAARRRMLRAGCQTCVANATIIGLRADAREALRSGQVPAALPTRAIRTAEKMQLPRLAEQAATARMLAVRLDIRRGNLKRAVETLGNVPRPGQLTPIDYRMLRRLCRAELAVAQGNRGKALTEIRSGLTELDAVRDRMGGLDLVSGTALHGQELADLAVKLVLERGDARRLFVWLERTRAQTYRYEPLSAGTDPELAARVAEVRGLGQAIQEAQHDGHPIAGLRAKYNERLREAQRLGWHTGRWGRPRPVAGLGEVVAQLRARALVSFAASGDELVAVVVAGGECRLVRLGSAGAAAESARVLNVDLDALAPDNLPERLAEVVMASARKQADKLDAQLIQPLAGIIGDRELVIVPTGPLYAVPWGVLPVLRGRPTVVAPSATAWLAAELTKSPRARKIVLVRGPGLAGARGELEKLTTHYRTATTMTGAKATVKSVLRAMDGAKLAHFAAHGAHEPENALFSRLELADGALFGHEMAGLRQPPRQVVFAACELALNRIRPGDEALGFASALLASGSRTVIAPLSRVGDLASAAAMDDYYRALAVRDSPALALADAIAVDPFRRPFVCLGSG